MGRPKTLIYRPYFIFLTARDCFRVDRALHSTKMLVVEAPPGSGHTPRMRAAGSPDTESGPGTHL